MTLSTEDAIFEIAFPVSEALGRGCVLSQGKEGLVQVPLRGYSFYDALGSPVVCR
jgi:hypothetical protein